LRVVNVSKRFRCPARSGYHCPNCKRFAIFAIYGLGEQENLRDGIFGKPHSVANITARFASPDDCGAGSSDEEVAPAS
jgi:hypothetical protein